MSSLDFDDFRRHVNSAITKLETSLVDHLSSNMEDMDTKVNHVKKLVETKLRDIDHLHQERIRYTDSKIQEAVEEMRYNQNER